MPKPIPFTATHAPEAEIAELAAKVGAKGRRTERLMDRLAQASPELYAAVREHILACDDYTVSLWTDFFDSQAPSLISRRRDEGVVDEMRRSFAVIEVVAALRPYEPPIHSPGGSVFHNRVYDLKFATYWSLRSARGKPVSIEMLRAVAFGTWVRHPFDPGGSALPKEALVHLFFDQEDLAFIAENFDAVMRSRTQIKERRSIDRSFVAHVIGSTTKPLDDGFL